jgi:hypothetical protein
VLLREIAEEMEGKLLGSDKESLEKAYAIQLNSSNSFMIGRLACSRLIV